MPINRTSPNIPYLHKLVNVKTLYCHETNGPTTLSQKHLIILANDSMQLYLIECLVFANKLNMKLFQIFYAKINHMSIFCSKSIKYIISTSKVIQWIHNKGHVIHWENSQHALKEWTLNICTSLKEVLIVYK